MKKQSDLLIWSLLLIFGVMTHGCSEGASSDSASESLEEFVFLSDKRGSENILNTKDFNFTSLSGPAWFKVSRVSDGVFWLYTGDVYLLYSTEGSEARPVSSATYGMVTDFASGRAIVGDGTEPIRVIDTKGKTVAVLAEDIVQAQPFSACGFAPVKNAAGKMGFIDRDGGIAIEPVYDMTAILGPDRLIAVKNVSAPDNALVSDYIIFDGKGQKVSEISGSKYPHFDPLHYGDGLFAQLAYDDEGCVRDNTVFISEDGREAFTLDIYSSDATEENYVFSCGLLAYPAVGGRWKVADTTGKTVFEGKYEKVSVGGHGRLIIQYSRKQSAVVDLDGNFVIPITDNVVFTPLANGSYLCEYDEPAGDGVMYFPSYYVQKNDQKTNTYKYASIGDRDVCSDVIWYRNLENEISPLLSGISGGRLFGFDPEMSAPEVAARAGARIENANDARLYEEWSINVELLQRAQYAPVSGFALFDGNPVEERTHVEKEGSGWFVTEKTVSDGYAFNPKARLTGFYITFNTLAPDVKPDDLANAVATALKNAGYRPGNGGTYEKDRVSITIFTDGYQIYGNHVGAGLSINFNTGK